MNWQKWILRIYFLLVVFVFCWGAFGLKAGIYSGIVYILLIGYIYLDKRLTETENKNDPD